MYLWYSSVYLYYTVGITQLKKIYLLDSAIDKSIEKYKTIRYAL